MDLIAKLKTCTGGETIDLANAVIPKTVLRGDRFPTPVTITGGTFDGLQMRDCAGFRFTGSRLLARVEVDKYYPNRLTLCENITFTDIEVLGDETLPVPDQEVTGLFLDGCERVSVERPHVHRLKHGIAHRGCDGLSVTDGRFHHLRVDGVRGNGSCNLTITGNHFCDFFPRGIGGEADHPDAIQLWTDPALPSRNILIARNIIERGDGETMQGIFCRGDYADERIPFDNLRIIDNDLTGTLWQGINVTNGSGEVRGNVLRALPDQQTWLKVENFTGPVEGNVAPRFLGDVPADKNTLGEAPPRIDVPAPEPEPETPEPEVPAEPVPAAPDALRRHLEKAEAEARAVMNTSRRAHYAVAQALELSRQA